MSANSYTCLNDFSIRPWDVPKLRPERFYQLNGSTIVIDYLGLDFLNLRVGDYQDQTGRAYHLHASASKFLAEIAHLSLQESPSEARREILFAGSIAIYRPGEIPGSQIHGYNLVAQGRIWASATDIEAAKKPGGLRDLVLGKFNHPEEAVARVELIIREFSCLP